jgi:Domain of unknown function (DUF1905)/Bacteriocin-protection, YdeI or OmpD-Associated
MHTFTATLTSAMEGPGDAWTTIVIPDEVAASFGTRAMVKVRGTIDGVPIRSSLMPDGAGGFRMMVNASIRKEAGVGAGDEVSVALEVDDDPRTVRTPTDLNTALKADPRAKAFWGALSYSNKSLYVEWIREAKQPETRARRVAETVQNMRDGKKRQR